MEKELLEIVTQFMIENDISCEETIHQTDSVIANAYDFITDLFNVVKPILPIDDEQTAL